MSAEFPLTLSHDPGIGWDGTHALMLDTMADVLVDGGPVQAQLTYLDEQTGNYVSVQGQWIAHDPVVGITFVTDKGDTLNVGAEVIERLSI